MPLYVCNHEPDDIVRLLKKGNLAVEVQHIESGDYIMGDVAIERKTTSDILNSLTNARIWTQLDTLRRTYPQPMLLIEGVIDWRDRMLAGVITTILLFWKYQLIFTHNKEETALVVGHLFTKYGVGKSNRPLPAAVRKATSAKDIKLAMLQVIPTVGPTMAKKILEAEPDIITIKYGKKLNKVKGLRKNAVEALSKVKG